ncbi:hypothetical protein [Runella sp.]|uniref:hypothetical protein n=1 Tax=Runella sp. TaxID=1960881 RepID=UPI003D128FF6
MIIEEKDLALARCRALVEKKVNWGSSNDWSTQDFERLSEQIAAATGVTLSATTLKRVWGKVRYDSVPTQTTLNALAQFLGYDNWRLFYVSMVTLNKNENGNELSEPALTVSTHLPVTSFWQRRRTLLIGCISVVIVAFISFLFLNNIKPPIDNSQVQFSSRKVTEELPNSVVFDYDIGNINADSVTIQQSWDRRRQERIAAHKGQHTSIYYYPGYFRAKLLVGDKIMKEHDIFIKTQGWQGIIDQKPIPMYLSKKETAGNSMEINAETLRQKTGKSVFNDIWTNFYLVKDFGVMANDFTFETILQNTSSKEESLCQKVKLRLLTSESAIAVTFGSKGCISDSFIFLGGTGISGKDRDMSALGCDFSTPQRLKCSVKNKIFTIFLNEKVVFTAPCNEDLGKMIGIVVCFEGTGRVERAEFL